MTDHTEIEAKLYVPDLDAVTARLTALGATLAHPRVFERNSRYDDAHGTLARDKRVLRLRQDTRTRLTLKEPATSSDGPVSERFEAEVTVDNFDTAHAILSHLGYRVVFTYEKYRTTYHLDGCEVLLDELPYGSFVEIEGPSRDAVQAVIARLNLTDAPAFGASYSDLFERVRHRLNLPVHNLTFDDFRGISVPITALQPE